MPSAHHTHASFARPLHIVSAHHLSHSPPTFNIDTLARVQHSTPSRWSASKKRDSCPHRDKPESRAPPAHSAVSEDGCAHTPVAASPSTRQFEQHSRLGPCGDISRVKPSPACFSTIYLLLRCPRLTSNMADVSNGSEAQGSQLRERPSTKPLHLNNADDAKQKVLQLNDDEDKKHKGDASKKRTYGRTPDGTGMSRVVEHGEDKRQFSCMHDAPRPHTALPLY